MRDLWAMYCAEFGVEDEMGEEGGEESEDEEEAKGKGTSLVAESVDLDDDVVLVEAEKEKGTAGASQDGSLIASGGIGTLTSRLAETYRKRLERLTFAGHQDGKRFLREFEALAEKAHPGIGDEDKKLLLVSTVPQRL